MIMLILIMSFLLSKWQNYMFLSSLYQQKFNQKQTKFLSKRFERSVYWNEHKRKIENGNATNSYRDVLELNFVEVNKLLVLIYPKKYSFKFYYLPKGIIWNYNIITNGKNFNYQPINSDIKWFEEINKLTTGQREDYTTGCLLDYE